MFKIIQNSYEFKKSTLFNEYNVLFIRLILIINNTDHIFK